MPDAPCKVCGYNGPGFYQPVSHPCPGNKNWNPAMTTDPKALIERLFAEIEHGDAYHRAWLLEALRTSPALRDLTAENERLTEQRDFLGTQAADLALKVGRLKALGDGLVGYVVHSVTCPLRDQSGEQCTCGLSAALAAWETK